MTRLNKRRRAGVRLRNSQHGFTMVELLVATIIVLLLATGTYGGFKLSARHFTAERPLVIKAAPGATPASAATERRACDCGKCGRRANSSRSIVFRSNGQWIWPPHHPPR